MSKVLQERGFRSLPSFTEANPIDQVKSISTTIEADSCPIRRRIHWTETTISFPSRLNGYYCEEKKESYGSWFKGSSTNACNRKICTMRVTVPYYTLKTRPDGDALRKCILEGPYTPTIVTTLDVPAIENSPAVLEQTTVETVMNMTPENRAHFESEKEAIHLIFD
ncbi:hypothetical protein Tco_1193354 [Tanacetum coccineum]